VGLPHGEILYDFTPFGSIGPLVCWETNSPSAKLEEVAPPHRFRNEHWLRPALNEAADELTPFMAWWAFLFALSILARYHPARWVASLDLDNSPLAQPLADALDQALSAVPHLVLQAVLRKSILPSRP
jgi:hypothetical protein